MIDITTIQTFKVPPSINVLQEANTVLKIANETLYNRNETMQKLLILSAIVIPVLSFIIYKNHQSKNTKK